MKKISFFVLMVTFMFSSAIALAKNPPNGVHNYIQNGHLYVWDGNKYLDMGLYNPG
ncbi:MULTISPECIES: hypothetical protein [Flavobacterium]|uniref:Uncharacterized protein n=1 Tax=Flavobacterium hankyongi TaxID=1176532 RepID=A0ABP8ZKA9_9FLAO|nr:hypothetical protein [Flavobacterium sp. N1846]